MYCMCPKNHTSATVLAASAIPYKVFKDKYN